MKFGKTFISHQIPEWSIYYMNYKQLKKIIKTIDQVINYNQTKVNQSIPIPELISSIISQFFYELDRDIEKVCDYYNNKFNEYNRRLIKIIHILSYNNETNTINHQIDTTDELDEIISILLELRSIFRNLKWFGELNHKGFIKILKKLDKKLSYISNLTNDELENERENGNENENDVNANGNDKKMSLPNNNKEIYLTTRVDALPFANEVELINGLNIINNILNDLGEQQYEFEQAMENATINSKNKLNGNRNDDEDDEDNNDTNKDSNFNKNFEILKIGSNRRYSFDQEFLEHYYELILIDDSTKLMFELNKIPMSKNNLKFLLSLLNKSTLQNSISCIDNLFQLLLNFVSTNSDYSVENCLFDKFDISGRNFFHQHIVSLGKKQVIKEQKEVTPGESSDINRLYGNKSGPDGIQLSPIGIDGLCHILNKIEFNSDLSLLKNLLISKDNYFRTPLHYSAQYGLKDVSKIFLNYLNKWNLIDVSIPIDNTKYWGDQEGLSPLHLSIIGKHPKTTENLILNSINKKLSCPNLLLLATRLNILEIVKNLIKFGLIDLNYTDLENNNETSLYIASKLNYNEIVNFLLEQQANTEIGENIFGWTPIFIAASEGFIDIVSNLKTNGAIFDHVDDSGWLPMEHACLRGHLKVADLLKPENDSLLLYDIENPSNNLSRIPNDSVNQSLTNSPILNSKNSLLNNNHHHLPNDDLSLLSTSSIDKLPESNKNAVNEVYKQFKQFDNGSSSSINLISSNSDLNLISNSPKFDNFSLSRGNSNNNGNGISTSGSLDQSNVKPSSSSNNRSRSRSPSNNNRRRRMKPIKSFGHRYLNKDESLILITLGTTDLRDNNKPINLNNISMSKTFFTELDTALSLIITCRNKQSNKIIETPIIIDLPLEDQHGSATDPITFKLTKNMKAEEIIITFDIVPTYQYSNDLKPINNNINSKNSNLIKNFKKDKSRTNAKILGRGVALLNSAYTRVGPNLRSLNNTITIPIIESDSLDILGSINFEYLCVESFSHDSMNIGRSDTYWKQLVSTRVIGHRGLGKNSTTRKSLQLGENTVESFIAAASLGASYVEFDVQLTKDYVPVVYHDFTVAESGVDIPMHALTAEQFLGLNDHSESKINRSKIDIEKSLNSKKYNNFNGNGDSNNNFNGGFNKNFTKNYSLDDEMLGKVNRPRSMSSYPSAPDYKQQIDENNNSKYIEEDDLDREFKDQFNSRMKLTKTWKDKGFKGNARGLSIASNFVTLKELFKKLPKKVGFNIELKYPMLDEAEMESMGEIAIDLNFYVDTILKIVYDENTTGRDILFSSFHPDICLLLSLKQPTIPILFLTEAGTEFMADIRASSLQNAIRFAKKWNLLGIVSAAKTLVKCPRLAQVIKSSGLVCVTYGVENNSPELAKIQMKAGVDAVIADSVLAVREGLRVDQNTIKEDSSD